MTGKNLRTNPTSWIHAVEESERVLPSKQRIVSVSILSRNNYSFWAMWLLKKRITHQFFVVDDEICLFRYEDQGGGSVQQDEAERSNKFWSEVFEQFRVEYLLLWPKLQNQQWLQKQRSAWRERASSLSKPLLSCQLIESQCVEWKWRIAAVDGKTLLWVRSRLKMGAWATHTMKP